MTLRIGDVADHFGVSIDTVRNWVKSGKLDCGRTPGGHRLFSHDNIRNLDLSGKHELKRESRKRDRIFYCRVSSNKQSDDLSRQIEFANRSYPDHEVITDIGSGLNWKRKGLKSLLRRIHEGNVSEVIVFHKDRLCRFGYELLEFICELNETRLLVHEEGNKLVTREQELAEDLLSIVQVFNCRNQGRRRYGSQSLPLQAEDKQRREEIVDKD